MIFSRVGCYFSKGCFQVNQLQGHGLQPTAFWRKLCCWACAQVWVHAQLQWLHHEATMKRTISIWFLLCTGVQATLCLTRFLPMFAAIHVHGARRYQVKVGETESCAPFAQNTQEGKARFPPSFPHDKFCCSRAAWELRAPFKLL